MNRTKTIYFLSAIVLIIGCFALNLSYSLFVQTEEKDVVNSVVPKIEIALSQIDEPISTLSDTEASNTTSYVLVEAGKEYIVKQSIINNSTIPINYGLNTNLPDNVSIATHDSIPNNLPYGLYNEDSTLDTALQPSTSKDVYLIVSNKDGEGDIAVTFSLEYSYVTLAKDSSISNIVNVTEVETGGLPFSDNTDTLAYKIIKRQADDFGSSVETVGDISVESSFTDNNGKLSLPLSVDGNELNVPSSTEFTGVETSNVGLYKAEDDYGMSYYFRGASSTNYLSFAGFTWRIVRINGDGSIRLIMDGSLDKVIKEGETTPVYQNEKLIALDSDGSVSFNSLYNDNAYVGYMYGEFTTNSTSYDEAHQNKKSSKIKTYLDTFYEEYLSDYEKYLADTMFCGDKTLAKSGIGGVATQIGFGTGTANRTYYAATERLRYSTGTTSITTATPTFKCAESVTNTYSRYTSDLNTSESTSKGVSVNNDLTYPIGLLSADELIFAGAWRSTYNTTYYLSDAYKNGTSHNFWWTMSPYIFRGANASGFLSSATTESLYESYIYNGYGVRPVINLRDDNLVLSGDGTKDSPYKLKEIS